MAYRDVSVVIPVAIDEDPRAVQELVSMILLDGSIAEIRVVTQGPGIDFPLGVNEKLIVRQQSDPKAKKTGALNDGLRAARAPFTIFCDADVVLKGDEIGIAREALEDADFVSANYGYRPVQFPFLGFFSGWFSGCRTNTFRDIGGFVNDPIEDVATSQKIKRGGYKIKMLPFSVSLRRPVRNPVVKGLGVLQAFMGHRQ